MFLLQLMSAVAFLNEHGIVHRDIKADNVMVTADDVAILIDFGTAASKLKPANKEGNVGAAPPEVLNAGEQSEYDYSKGDVWALGCLAYLMVKTCKCVAGCHAVCSLSLAGIVIPGGRGAAV